MSIISIENSATGLPIFSRTCGTRTKIFQGLQLIRIRQHSSSGWTLIELIEYFVTAAYTVPTIGRGLQHLNDYKSRAADYSDVDSALVDAFPKSLTLTDVIEQYGDYISFSRALLLQIRHRTESRSDIRSLAALDISI